MADVHSNETRSYNMSRIKGKDTKPEMMVRKFLHKKGFRFRLHDKKLPGKPDIVLAKYRTVIMVHGCFWHGHEGCKYFVVPKTKAEWWQNKIKNTQRKDSQNYETLNSLKWNLITVWECELKGGKKDETLFQVEQQLCKNLKKYQ